MQKHANAKLTDHSDVLVTAVISISLLLHHVRRGNTRFFKSTVIVHVTKFSKQGAIYNHPYVSVECMHEFLQKKLKMLLVNACINHERSRLKKNPS